MNTEATQNLRCMLLLEFIRQGQTIKQAIKSARQAMSFVTGEIAQESEERE